MRYLWIVLFSWLALGGDAQTVVARGKDSVAWVKEGNAAWVALDGSLGGAPDACRSSTGDLYIVVRGTDDGGWIKRQQPDGKWTPWLSLGGRLTSDLSVICVPDGTARAFARYRDQTLAVHSGKPGDGWESIGGRLDGTPDVSVSSKGVIDVVVRGSDEMVWHARFTGSAWLPWRSLGVRTTSDPTIARLSDDRVEIVVTQGEGVPHHGTLPESGTMTVTSMGGVVRGSPDASSLGDGRMDVVARGADNGVLLNSYDGKLWSGWKNLGGDVSSDATVAPMPAPVPAPRKRITKS
jgi:hypothetical protein